MKYPCFKDKIVQSDQDVMIRIQFKDKSCSLGYILLSIELSSLRKLKIY